MKKKDQFAVACQKSVKATLVDLYQSRREEVQKWLKSEDRNSIYKHSVDQRDSIAKSWADQIGKGLQATIQQLYVNLTRELEDDEVN